MASAGCSVEFGNGADGNERTAPAGRFIKPPRDVENSRIRINNETLKPQNATIDHCISCGRIEHVESEAEPPPCCGQMMAKACEETVRGGDAAGEKVGDHCETASTVIKGSTKPR